MNTKDKTSNRIGETRTMNNGMKATIIAYRSCMDIDVQFEDGQIREGVVYGQFKNGSVAHPDTARVHDKNKRIGETRVMNNGIKATIIACRNYHDLDVQFEDGAIKENVHYLNFSKGEVQHPKYSYRYRKPPKTGRIGETKKMSNGMKATIINYRTCADIDVQFEDGQVKEGVRYDKFSKGRVVHPASAPMCDKTKRLGEIRVMSNDMKATVIEYRKANDIDVQFEDGKIREGISYDKFKKGFVAHPDAVKEYRKSVRLGETRVMTNGMNATIITYRSCVDMDVQFEDGQVKEGVKYDNFLKGRVAHPSYSGFVHIGENRAMTNGMKATVINYRTHTDIDVQFEDGKVKECVSYNAFRNGHVAHPDNTYATKKEIRVGETRTMTNGMKTTIIAYRSNRDMDVRFEDGQVREGVQYTNFLRGNIAHPDSCRKK